MTTKHQEEQSEKSKEDEAAIQEALEGKDGGSGGEGPAEDAEEEAQYDGVQPKVVETQGSRPRRRLLVTAQQGMCLTGPGVRAV